MFHRRDPTGKDVITFIRPMNCAGMCCGIFYPHCTQALTVSINGESAGMCIMEILIVSVSILYTKSLTRKVDLPFFFKNETRVADLNYFNT